MKKFITIIALTISILQINFAQTNEGARAQMEQFQRQMQDMVEQLSKQLGGNGFFFDTTFVQPFDFHSFDGMPFDSAFVKQFEFPNFDGDNFPFDTSMMREFHRDIFGDTPIKMDTFYLKEYKNFGSDEMPDSFLNEDFSKQLGEMMEQMQRHLEQLGQPYDEDGAKKEWKSKPEDGDSNHGQPTPKPASKKKRKTTII